LESAAFLVSKGRSEKEAHTEIVQSLVLLAQIESEINDLLESKDNNNNAFNNYGRKTVNSHLSNYTSTSTSEIDIEVNKVKRKTPRWFKNPNQYNSTILIGFLELSEQQLQVSTHMLKNKCHQVNDFEGHYNQMKNFGAKNYGKVFEEKDGIIMLWEPVKEYILELYNQY
ncbi:MAG: hypothetical protein Q9N02_02375, partial [Ghiorsea sp.]|nr:hypothetical protein [Ghiorsea sp.]